MVVLVSQLAGARGHTTKRDVIRIYKELMKAAMRVSNPKLRVIVYDSIRHEFRSRKHMRDPYAISEAAIRGATDLQSLRDARMHPFLHVNEDGTVTAPRISDPNAPTGEYVPGPVLSILWGIIFIGGGGFVYGLIAEWLAGRSWYGSMDDPNARPASHKGIPQSMRGTAMNWKYDPPTGPEIVDFRSQMLVWREEEAEMEAELLDLEAKVYATQLSFQDEAAANQAKALEAERTKETSKGWFW